MHKDLSKFRVQLSYEVYKSSFFGDLNRADSVFFYFGFFYKALCVPSFVCLSFLKISKAARDVCFTIVIHIQVRVFCGRRAGWKHTSGGEGNREWTKEGGKKTSSN